ncbi:MULTISPECIES: class I SAM-dependent methyltransferase [unclassified Acinetobacter]|uniref:class I SAM-dependent methyltransferase n=1 Tax=unclassified Acinetobacter TaxID=196816 RepID=UPI003C7A953A
MAEKCRICNRNLNFIFYGNIFNNNILYYECPQCLYVQTQKPYWLEQAYSEAIHTKDTGIFVRNYLCCKKTTNLCWLLGIKNKKILDYAGGYGIFVRLMRDIGFQIFWEDRYCDNLFAKKFVGKDGKYELITAFEVFEHFDKPVEELTKILNKSDQIFFSTKLIPDPTPSLENWDYYGLEHGQHIGFFRGKTLEYLALKFNKYLYSYGDFHFFSSTKISKINFLLIMKFYNFFFFFFAKKNM